MCDKKCKCAPTQPLTLGQIRIYLYECGMVHKKGETLCHQDVVFDFPNQAPSHFRQAGERLVLVPMGDGERTNGLTLDVKIQMAMDAGSLPTNPVWVDVPRDWDTTPHAPEDSQAKIGVVGVKDNGQEIIILTAYLG